VSLFKRLRAETAWEPTPAQQEAALHLAKSEVGFVRTHDDGTTDLRTIENGGLRRYIIAQNGEVALVESGAALPGFAWSDRLGAAGMLVFFRERGRGVHSLLHRLRDVHRAPGDLGEDV
jgi:hypothetical protein